jgi:hypothetical protein
VRSSKAAMTTTGEVIKQEKVVKEGSCGVLPHLYAHEEAAKKAPLFPSTSYPLRFRYDFEAKDLVRGSSLPGRLFKKYYITRYGNKYRDSCGIHIRSSSSIATWGSMRTL